MEPEKKPKIVRMYCEDCEFETKHDANKPGEGSKARMEHMKHDCKKFKKKED